MALAQATRDKLISAGTARIAAALAKHGLRRQSLSGLRPLSPFQDALAGAAAKAIDACPPGGVLVMESSVTSVPVALLARRKVAGVVSNGPLRNAAEIARAGLPAWQRPSGPPTKPLPIEAGDVLLGDRAGLIVIPAGAGRPDRRGSGRGDGLRGVRRRAGERGRRRLRPAHPERRACPPRLRRLAAHQGPLARTACTAGSGISAVSAVCATPLRVSSGVHPKSETANCGQRADRSAHERSLCGVGIR